MTEITFLLGFNDTSNFTRAFKRWTGMSPTEYRHKRYRQYAADHVWSALAPVMVTKRNISEFNGMMISGGASQKRSRAVIQQNLVAL